MESAAKNLFKIILGLVLIVLPIYLIAQVSWLESWGRATIALIQGGIVLLVILIGLVFVVIGFTEMRS